MSVETTKRTKIGLESEQRKDITFEGSTYSIRSVISQIGNAPPLHEILLSDPQGNRMYGVPLDDCGTWQVFGLNKDKTLGEPMVVQGDHVLLHAFGDMIEMLLSADQVR